MAGEGVGTWNVSASSPAVGESPDRIDYELKAYVIS